MKYVYIGGWGFFSFGPRHCQCNPDQTVERGSQGRLVFIAVLVFISALMKYPLEFSAPKLMMPNALRASEVGKHRFQRRTATRCVAITGDTDIVNGVTRIAFGDRAIAVQRAGNLVADRRNCDSSHGEMISGNAFNFAAVACWGAFKRMMSGTLIPQRSRSHWVRIGQVIVLRRRGRSNFGRHVIFDKLPNSSCCMP